MSCHERPLLCCWSCCYCTKLSSVVLCLVHITFLTKNARRHFFLPSIECQDTPTKNPLPPSTDSTNSRKEENNNANNSQPASIYIELLVSTFLSKYFSFDFICAFEVFVWSSLFFFIVCCSILVKFPWSFFSAFRCWAVLWGGVRCCVSSRVEDVKLKRDSERRRRRRLARPLKPTSTVFACANVLRQTRSIDV